MRKGHLPGLDGLRFVGAFVVMASHLEAMKPLFGFKPFWWLPVPGKVGVVLFFALSGFLITYLLFRDGKTNEYTSWRNFYFRRMLRIWPLYFLVTGLSYVFYNQFEALSSSVGTKPDVGRVDLLFLALVLPNLAGVSFPYSAQNWSIGIEEQFYAFQPVAVKSLNRRALVCALLAVVFAKEICSLIVASLGLCAQNTSLICAIGQRIAWQLQYLGCIAIGCLFCLLIVNRCETILRIMFSRTVQLATLGVLAIALQLAFIKQQEDFIEFRWYAVLLSIVVINASHNPASLIKLENKYFRFLGEISYGLYMFHPMCFAVVLYLVKKAIPNHYSLTSDVAIYFGAFGLTVVIAKLSLVYFEGFFRKLRFRPGSFIQTRTELNSTSSSPALRL